MGETMDRMRDLENLQLTRMEFWTEIYPKEGWPRVDLIAWENARSMIFLGPREKIGRLWGFLPANGLLLH